MTDLDYIRQACIRVNPEILSLDFGCVFRASEHKNPLVESPVKPGGYRIIQREFHSRGATYEIFFIAYTSQLGDAIIRKLYDDKIKSMQELGLFEIIGRPIRLADVLLAMAKSTKVRDEGYTFCSMTVDMWDLSIDDVTRQSDKTKKFIANLLDI